MRRLTETTAPTVELRVSIPPSPTTSLSPSSPIPISPTDAPAPSSSSSSSQSRTLSPTPRTLAPSPRTVSPTPSTVSSTPRPVSPRNSTTPSSSAAAGTQSHPTQISHTASTPALPNLANTHSNVQSSAPTPVRKTTASAPATPTGNTTSTTSRSSFSFFNTHSAVGVHSTSPSPLAAEEKTSKSQQIISFSILYFLLSFMLSN